MFIDVFVSIKAMLGCQKFQDLYVILTFQVSKAESEARIMTKYKDLIEQGRQQFQKELESIVPEVKMGIKKGKGFFNTFILAVCVFDM